MTSGEARSHVLAAGAIGCVAVACSTAGSTWVAEPFSIQESEPTAEFQPPSPAPPAAGEPRWQTCRILGEPDPLGPQKAALARGVIPGRVAGVFRNTYYDFPEEASYGGEPTSLFNAACGLIARVPQDFHDALCVQGSGVLASGRTVSFARRDCACARRCPRTDQQICFEALDIASYPWGRGALGQPIVPLLTVAVDSSVIPLGTSIFVPEYVGLPREPGPGNYGRAAADGAGHDGCFIAQDRGIKVRGQHVDIFTGREELTRLWNALVPSNEGVTVILESPFCERADIRSALTSQRAQVSAAR